MATRRSSVPRLRRPRRLLRWLALGALALIGLLYYQPLRSYLETRAEVAERAAEVRSLREERNALRRKLAESSSAAAFQHQARRLGLVRPGERLFIVKGIATWRRTMPRDGR